MSRLIDADKLHSEFMKMAEFKPNSEIGEPTCGCTRRLVFHISEGIRKINEQPTVDAEPIRHGQWNKEEDTLFRLCVYKCSLCGGEVLSEAYLFKYCPYCGARMDGE